MRRALQFQTLTGLGIAALISTVLIGAALLPASGQSQPQTSLATYSALRFCAYRLDGLDNEEATAAALADLQGRYYALIGTQLPAIRSAMPALSRRACPEAFPGQGGAGSQPALRLPAVNSCSPTLRQTNQAAAGQTVTIGGTANCQIRLN